MEESYIYHSVITRAMQIVMWPNLREVGDATEVEDGGLDFQVVVVWFCQ